VIDLEVAKRFIAALYGDADADVQIQTFDDDEGRKTLGTIRKGLISKPTGNIETLAPRLGKLNTDGAGIFLQINPGKRGKKNVTGLAALFIDDDGVGYLKPDLDALPPSISVKSGGGLDRPGEHHYWILKPGEDPERFEAAQRALAKHFGTDKAVVNLDRVMRLPGSLHKKRPPPAPVTILHVAEPRTPRTIDEILGAFKLSTDGAVADGQAPPAGGPVEDENNDGPPEGNPAQIVSATKLEAKLREEKIAFRKTGPFNFKLANCLFNAAHGDTMDLKVLPRGGFWGGCFHNSCGGNTQQWDRVKEKLRWGGGQLGFNNGGHPEIARRVLADARGSSLCEIVFSDGKFWRYSEVSGLWEVV
jgi:hypothetical protein